MSIKMKLRIKKQKICSWFSETVSLIIDFTTCGPQAVVFPETTRQDSSKFNFKIPKTRKKLILQCKLRRISVEHIWGKSV